jgi:hypothetical protein
MPAPGTLPFFQKVEAIMAKRVLNRRELRKQGDEAERAKPKKETSAEAPAKKGAKAEAGAPAKVKKVRKKKEPPRLCARWGVFDAGMKQIAVFDFNQKAAADQKIADLSAKKNARYFLQIVKEPMAEPPTPEAIS